MATNTYQFLQTCFIQDAIDGKYVAFQLMPDEIQHVKSVNWQDQDIIGRAFPLKGYSNSSARTVNLALTFASDLGIGGGNGNNVNVVKVSDWFMSFMYPDISSRLVAPPHPVWLSIASMITMKGVLNDVTVTYKPPWDYAKGIGTICEVSFSVTEIGSVNVGHIDVRNGKYVEASNAKAPAPGKVS